MSRSGLLFSILLFVLALGGGSIVHASEGLACFEGADVSANDTGPGEAPLDSDKALAHHHGGCHGHHAGIPITDSLRVQVAASPARLSVMSARHLVASGPDPALRPPQA